MTKKGHVWARLLVLIELYLALSIGVFYVIVFVLFDAAPDDLQGRSFSWLGDAISSGVRPAVYILWMGPKGFLLSLLLAASLILPFVFGRRYIRASEKEWSDWLFLYVFYWFLMCGLSAFLYVSFSKAAF